MCGDHPLRAGEENHFKNHQSRHRPFSAYMIKNFPQPLLDQIIIHLKVIYFNELRSIGIGLQYTYNSEIILNSRCVKVIFNYD
jgi:hypothetical protein